MFTRKLLIAALAGSALSLSACSNDNAGDTGADTAATEPSSQTLAALIGDADGYDTVADAMQEAGLSEVFDGNAAYTVLLPSDQSFQALEEGAPALDGEQKRAAMVAILRDHIFPGYFTPEDIAKSIGEEDGSSVSMKSMGQHELKFTRMGDTITVTNSSDGSTATIDGNAMVGSNGVAIPLDGVLKKVEPEAAA